MPNTTHFAIFDYWKDKMVKKNGEVITRKEFCESQDKIDAVHVVFDWFEIQCWACGKVFRHEKEAQERARKKKNPINAIWQDPEVKSFYERCHIVPRTLGGKDEPSNLFLLCPDCHALSPDTTNPQTFLRWVYRTQKNTYRGWSSVQEMNRLIREEMEARGYESMSDVLIAFCSVFEPKGNKFDTDYFQERFRKYIGKNVGLHAYKISESSIIGATCDFLEEIYKEANNSGKMIEIGNQYAIKEVLG